MEAVARVLEASGRELLHLAATCQGFLADPDLVASTALDPVGAAACEAALGEALDGPAGLCARAVEVMVEAAKLRATVWTVRAEDELQAAALQVLRFGQGALFPLALPAVLPAGLVLALGDKALGRDPAADAQHLLVAHPGIVDDVVGSAPSFIGTILAPLELSKGVLAQFGVWQAVTPASFFPVTVAQGASLAGLLYPETNPRVEPVANDEALPRTVPPANLNDVMSDFQNRNTFTDQNRHLQSEIDVRAITTKGPGGSPHVSGYIVDIPGTKDWQFAGPRPYLNDFGTNVHALAGEPTAYENGIEKALSMAGVPPDAPIMLVGHSQGGMVAVRAANDFVTAGKFNVTHVVTAGSPVGGMQVPKSVQVLSMENAHDIVPHLDGRPNHDLPNWTTVSVDRGAGDISSNHDARLSYLPIAVEVDTSSDPSVRHFLGSSQAFLGGSSVSTRVYAFHRSSPPLAPTP
jgi:PGAP1-like protein